LSIFIDAPAKLLQSATQLANVTNVIGSARKKFIDAARKHATHWRAQENHWFLKQSRHRIDLTLHLINNSVFDLRSMQSL
jgi:hypothetical protein